VQQNCALVAWPQRQQQQQEGSRAEVVPTQVIEGMEAWEQVWEVSVNVTFAGRTTTLFVVLLYALMLPIRVIVWRPYAVPLW